jgi:hypothetical protein
MLKLFLLLVSAVVGVMNGGILGCVRGRQVLPEVVVEVHLEHPWLLVEIRLL